MTTALEAKTGAGTVYPYLGQTEVDCKTIVVLFFDNSEGSIIHSTHPDFHLGQFGDGWDEGDFKRLAPGSKVTITQ